MELLRRKRLAFANDDYTILTVETGALDRTIVLARNTHVGPVNVSGFNIDNHAIWHSASAENDLSIRPVGVHRMNPAAASFEKKQATNSPVRGCALRFGNFCNRFHALIFYFILKLWLFDISDFVKLRALLDDPPPLR
jgi:hypothetical protein